MEMLYWPILNVGYLGGLQFSTNTNNVSARNSYINVCTRLCLLPLDRFLKDYFPSSNKSSTAYEL